MFTADLHLRSCCQVLSHASTVHPHSLEGFYMGQAPGPKIRRIWADTIWALKYQPSFSTVHLYLLYPWHSRHFLATSLGPAFASLSLSYISTPSHQRLPGALIPHFQAALCSRLPRGGLSGHLLSCELQFGLTLSSDGRQGPPDCRPHSG